MERNSDTSQDDQFVHLANNSISKNSDKFDQVYEGEDGSFKVEGNMWHSDDFAQFLKDKPGLWKDKIQKQMKDIVSWSLQCVQDSVSHRKNACELYGYDFMIDENYQPWLIEVNSSPACDYSTPVTKRYVEEGLEDIIKVIVDRNTCTGKWELAYRGSHLPQPASSLGNDFEIKGTRMKRRRERRCSRPAVVEKETAVLNETDEKESEETDPLL